MNLTIKQRVKLICDKSEITMSELAGRIGVAASPFSLRLKTGKFTKAELEKLAEEAGCKYVCYFKFDNGMEFMADSIGQQIKDSLEHIEMSATELGRKLGLTQQAMSKRMSIGKFTQADLETIAGYMGCEYVSEFRFDDGTVL